MDVAASMLEAAGTSATRRGSRSSGSTATPAAGRCSRPPATSARTGSAPPRSATTRTPTARRPDGEPARGSLGMAAAPSRRPSTRPRSWDDFFAAHYGEYRSSPSGCSRTAGVTHPARGHRSAGRGRLRRGARGAGCAASLAEAMPLGQGRGRRRARRCRARRGRRRAVRRRLLHRVRDPGLDILLARDLGMADRVQRLHVGHMGCYAALPGLGAVADFVRRPGQPGGAALPGADQPARPAPDAPTCEQVVAHALFADARRRGGPASPADAARVRRRSTSSPGTDVDPVDHMTWDVTDLGFRMGLSPRVPDVLARHVAGVVDDLLADTVWPSPTWTAGRCTRAGGGSSRSCSAELGLAADDVGPLVRGAAGPRQLLLGHGAAGAGADARGRARGARPAPRCPRLRSGTDAVRHAAACDLAPLRTYGAAEESERVLCCKFYQVVAAILARITARRRTSYVL